MLYLITGNPGAGKTLNSFKEIIHNKMNFKRQVYYFNIPCNLLDYEYCKTFQAFFYSYYLESIEVDERKLVNKRVSYIEKKLKRLVDISDFPFLQKQFEDEYSPFDMWLSSLNRVAPPHYQSVIKKVTDQAKSYEQALNFEHFEKYNFHWTQIDDVKQWHLLDGDSIFICDEAQEYFPVRVKEKTPEYIAAFERHRHSGFDVYLMTQQPSFIDVHARRLVGTHIHFYRPFNSKTTSRLEWSKTHNPDDYHDRQSAQKSRVKNDPRFYGIYRSAISHNSKFKLPKILLLVPCALLLLIFCLFMVYSTFFTSTKPKEVKSTSAPKETIQKSAALNVSGALPDSPYDDPVYSKLRKPITYPQLSCFNTVFSETRHKCVCYTQQFTKFNVKESVCLDIVENGFFDHSLSSGRSSRPDGLSTGGIF